MHITSGSRRQRFRIWQLTNLRVSHSVSAGLFEVILLLKIFQIIKIINKFGIVVMGCGLCATPIRQNVKAKGIKLIR